LLRAKLGHEVRRFMITTFEPGILQAEQRSALRQLEAKFGPLSAQVRQRVEALTSEQLAQL
jgi:hypothetical protein